MHLFVERAEGGVIPQQLPLRCDVRVKLILLQMRRAAAGQKLFEDAPQRCQLHSRHALVFDELSGAQLFNLAPHVVIQVRVADSLHVQINEVAEKRALRQIGAGVIRLAIGDRMQRIQRDERRSGGAKASIKPPDR